MGGAGGPPAGGQLGESKLGEGKKGKKKDCYTSYMQIPELC